MNKLIKAVEQQTGMRISATHIIAFTVTTVLALYVWWELIVIIIGACAYFYWHMKEKEKVRQQQKAMMIERDYIQLAEFLFHPLRDMTAWLDIKSPQGVKDIMTFPNFVRQGDFVFLSFKLLKLTSAKIDDEKLTFAENALVAIVQDELLATARDNCSFVPYFRDMPILHLHSIDDMGGHFRVLFIVVNQHNYEFVKSRSVFPLPVDETKLPMDSEF